MNQENMTKIYARSDSRIQLKVIPGHFVTSQSHITQAHSHFPKSHLMPVPYPACRRVS